MGFKGWWLRRRGARNGSVWQHWNGNRNVAYLWSNADKRNLNLNWFENDWNDNYRFLAVR
ncbi:MAG: hypothetical protein Q7S83_03855 [bacterium]|nr:hypothetical protein [bacterium]